MSFGDVVGHAGQGTVASLALDGELTIYRAAELNATLLDAVRAHPAPVFDLSAVTEFDSAGLQLLLVARQEAARLGKGLRFSAASPAVREVFALLHLPCDEGAQA